MELRKKTRIRIIRITASLFKEDTKYQLQIPHRSAFQDPNRSSSSSKRGKHG